MAAPDKPTQLAPTKTLKRLPTKGILVAVTIVAAVAAIPPSAAPTANDV